MSLRPRVVVYVLVGIGLVLTIASMVAVPQEVRWRPYLWGVGSVVIAAAVVYYIVMLSLRRMVARVPAANPANEQMLVAVADDQWPRLGVELSSLSGVRYAVLDVGAMGIRIYVGVDDPRLLTLIPPAGLVELEATKLRLGAVTRSALRISRPGGMPAIVLTPITPSFRSYSSDEIASRIPSFLRAMGRAVA